MSPDSISDMIAAIPLVMIYIVPEYIILRISNFQLSKKTEHDQYILIKSLIVSFVIVSAGEILWNLMFPGTQALASSAFRNAVIVLSMAAGILWSKFLTGELFER